MDNKISKLSNIIVSSLKNTHNKVIEREYKNNSTFSDLFLHSALMYSNDVSNINGTSKLALLDDTKHTVTTQVIHKKKIKIDSDHFDTLSLILLIQFYAGSNRFYAIDGSKISISKAIHEENNNFKLTPTGNYAKGLVSGLYDVINEIPVITELFDHENEREALKTHVKVLNPGDTIIADRGYYSEEIVAYFTERNINVMMRTESTTDFQS